MANQNVEPKEQTRAIAPSLIEDLECDLADAKFYLMGTYDLIGAIDILTGTESEYRTDADFGFKEAALVLAQSEEVPEDYTSLEDLRSNFVDIMEDQKRVVDVAERDLATAKMIAFDQLMLWIHAELDRDITVRRAKILTEVQNVLNNPKVEFLNK